MLKGIDVSEWQGTIDWSKVKDEVDFVILRAGYGRLASQKDKKFEENYAECVKYNIPKGVYWFSYAKSADEAVLEAEACLECIKGKKFEYPVWFDFEETRQARADIASNVIPAFIEKVSNAGYNCGLYSYYSMLKNIIPSYISGRYDIWLAHYASSTSWNNKTMWQYSSTGRVNGINGDVDMNYCYKEYYPSSSNIKEEVKYNKLPDGIKSYSYNDRTQLSPHFNVQEFRCKCGGNHNILINGTLVNKLEEMFNIFDCSKIIVNSGHRCSKHDKNVGGSGYGQHVDGNAADVVLYDKNNQIISTKKVSCVAQDIGFMGIGNIDSSYTAIHVDVRKNNKWYGNEVVNNNTVTNDFYKYYGLTKKDVYGEKYNEQTIPSEPVKEPVQQPTTITAGATLNLNKVPLFSSASIKKYGNTISGIYYIYNNEIVNERIRITNSLSNVGKTPIGNYVTGWVRTSDIK